MLQQKRAVAALLAVALLACGGSPDAEPTEDRSLEPANAVARDTLGSADIRDSFDRSYGTLYFAQAPGGVEVFGTLRNFPPGEFGMHLHSVGLCEGPEFTSAGGHWNPEGREHGFNNPNGPHLGDLPNIIGGEDSIAYVRAMTIGGTFQGDSSSLLDADGAAVIIHLHPDDYMTDPVGNAGPRGACGVIRE